MEGQEEERGSLPGRRGRHELGARGVSPGGRPGFHEWLPRNQPETQVKFELTFCDGSQGRLILPSLSRGSSQGPPAFLAPRAPAHPLPLSGCAPCLSVPMAPWARRGEGRTGGAMQGADGELAGQLPVRACGSPRTASSRAVPTRLRWTLLFSPLTDEETEARSGRSGSNR